MSSFRLSIEHGEFRDSYGRQVVLRGLNVAGDAKLPSKPDQRSHIGQDFFNGDSVNFHERPFTCKDAAVHFERIKQLGFNTIRYLFTWEAIEAAGPGIYDEEWIQHTIDILRIAKKYGFYVFMDPHQDTWSRFTGGSGAPMWTIYACGLEPRNFAATEAAIVQNVYPDPDGFPRMLWATNYHRLATSTIFTMFFAGKDFAPKCIIDGVNIEDYLQNHFISACMHLAKRIHEAGDLENQVVVGWESLNEPSRGMIGCADLSVIPKELYLRKGTCPTMWQTFLTGMGRTCEIDVWEMGGFGPFKTGTSWVNSRGKTAWLAAGHDARYGWKRDPGWKLGECVWAQHGVWDISSNLLVDKHYFAKNPRTGKRITCGEFTNTYFMTFWRRFSKGCRQEHQGCIMLMQHPTLEMPPEIKGTEDDDPNMASTIHYYDATVITKHWSTAWGVDVVGVLRGKYLHPAFAIKLGETAIRNCLRKQLVALRQEVLERTGKHPCLMTEFGIPFDMDGERAYRTGNYSSQSSALDASYSAAEGSHLEGYFQWQYCTINDHKRGDQWNGEDMSIVSVDDRDPRQQLQQTDTTLIRPTSCLDETVLATEESNTTSETDSDSTAHAPIAATLPAATPWRSSMPAYRAAEAFIRPTATTVVGTVLSSGFALRERVYTLKIHTTEAAAEDAPTIVFVPDLHFPKGQCNVDASAGRWALVSDDDEGTTLQKLKWWYPRGEHWLTIYSDSRSNNVSPKTQESHGYLERCRRRCVIM